MLCCPKVECVQEIWGVIFLVVPPKMGLPSSACCDLMVNWNKAYLRKRCIDFVEYRCHLKFEIEPYMCPCCPQACEKFNLSQNFKINILSEVTQW
jgi:hypothetical protein